MRKIILSAIILIALASCGNKKKSPATGDTIDTNAAKPVVMDAPQKVIYKSATYYAGRVDFYFVDEKGEIITVGISNLPEDSGAVYPKYLLEPDENLEGPPGENPAMVGKPFLLIKNAAGEVREIKPAN
jgi:hypothetical protein